MPRKKDLINYPRLIDNEGNLAKKWYVEFSFLDPVSHNKLRYRIYDGLNTGTVEERRTFATQLISYYNKFLTSGDYLREEVNYHPLRETELFRPECQMWIEASEKCRVSKCIEDYKTYIAPSVRKSTFRTYVGELEDFRDYVLEKLDNRPLRDIEREDIIPFFIELASEGGKNLCKETIKRYIGRVYSFFDWCIDYKRVDKDFRNPVYKIPNYGKIVDCAPALIEEDERLALKNAIYPRQPYLWLACELMYYCALRPGTEIRLLKVGDVDRRNRVVTVIAEHAKNKKTQNVDVPQPVIDLMEHLGVFNYDPDAYIFTKAGFPGHIPVSIHYFTKRYNMYRDQLGISKNRTFYSWKHAGAISCSDNGMNIYDLKDHLRHASIATTEEYLKRRRPKKHEAEKYIARI